MKDKGKTREFINELVELRRRVEQTIPERETWSPAAIMFVPLCILVWLNEIVDLPHLVLGAPPTPTNWREALLETFLIAAIGLFAILSNLIHITRSRWTQDTLEESEQKYRTMIEQSNDMIWTMDTEGNLDFFNPRCEELSGHRFENWQGKSFAPLIVEQDLPLVTDVFGKTLNGEPQHYKVRVKKHNGDILILSVNTAPILKGGQIVGTVSFGRNITERKQAEKERTLLLAQIQEQAQQVQQIIDTIPEGVLLLNTDGQVILANPVAEGDLVALANAKIKEKDTLTHLGDRPLAELLTSPPKGVWHKMVTDNRRFEAIARPLEAGPTPKGWVLVIRDVTREREIQRYSQQQERLAAVGQLAAGIAHDFNNIMGVIVLYTRIALKASPHLSSKSRDRLTTVVQQAKRASDLIQQILDFSRRAVLERQPLDLAPLLKEQVKLLKRTLPENIEIALDYGPDEHATLFIVNADPTRMQQVIINLAVNARDAMPEGGTLRFGLKRIEIKPGESLPLPEMDEIANREWVQVTVTDTGTGIPSDVLPHIFEPFFTTKSLGEGTGLGLAQAYGIIKQHEGEIDAQSQMGQGTTFSIYLPALSVEGIETAALKTDDIVHGQGETILVVEDDTRMREALVDTLETLDYRALAAANGYEALAILEQFPPQSAGEEKKRVALVLSDVVMPGMGGIALLHTLRQRGLAVKMVLLTGHPLEKEMESLRAQGVIDWLPKPPNLERLARTLAQALNLGAD